MDDTSLPTCVNPLVGVAPTPTPTPAPVTDRTQLQRDIADRPANLLLPLYASANEAQSRYLLDAPLDYRDDLDRVFGGCAIDLGESSFVPVDDLRVFKHALQLIVAQGWIRRDHDPNHADIHWAWVRMLLAGAGYRRHKELASYLDKLFPLCPLDPNATYVDWRKAVSDAHGLCGWPANIAWVDFGAVSRVYQPVDIKPTQVPRWLKTMALFHAVKHCRYDRFGEYPGMSYQYLGNRGKFRLAAPTETLPPQMASRVVQVLGTPGSRTKEYHEPAIALIHFFAAVPTDQLIHTVPRAGLDPRIILAPGAHLVPCPDNNTGFVRTGVGVHGAWRARQGTVRKTNGTHALTLDVHWGSDDAGDSDQVALFSASVPSSYQTAQLPSQLMIEAFPNIRPHTMDLDAWHCLVSAVILSGLMPRVGAFKYERPLVVCMPDGSTMEESTDTGKTNLALAISRIWAPALTQAVRQGAGAPAQRSLFAGLERHGTTAIDEFQFDRKNQESLFSETNLMTMATGGTPTVGRAFGNSEYPLRLTAPLCLSVKVWDGKDDLFNRTLPLRVERFSEHHLKNSGEIFESVQSGKWSMQARLAALHIIDTLRLEPMMNHTPAPQGYLRFGKLRLLSAVLLAMRCPGLTTQQAFDRIDNVAKDQHESQHQALNAAVESGMRTEARGVSRLVMSVGNLIDELTPTQFDELAARLGTEAVSPRQFFEAWVDARGWTNRRTADILKDLTGDAVAGSNALTRALNHAFTRIMPEPDRSTYQLPGIYGVLHGWHLVRQKDHSRYSWYTLEQRSTVSSTVSDPFQFCTTLPPVHDNEQEETDDADSTAG